MFQIVPHTPSRLLIREAVAAVRWAAPDAPVGRAAERSFGRASNCASPFKTSSGRSTCFVILRHRVLSSAGELTGYAFSVKARARLLKHERAVLV